MRASSGRPRLAARASVGLALAVGTVAVAAVQPAAVPIRDPRPNVVVILTDDQTRDSLPHDPPVMPKLQAMVEDASDHWISFPNAFLSTPLCCPSRATILTGRHDLHTGVRTNFDGHRLDPSATIAAWLHDAGYRTGLVGKYLNGYPFPGTPLVPPGWDRWFVKQQGAQSTAYYRHVLLDQGFPTSRGDAPADYLTDVLAAEAVDFIASATTERPFFLMIAPTAPHRPWTPAPRDSGAYSAMAIEQPPSIGEVDVSDKPAWVRALPEMTPERRVQLTGIRRRSFETLRAVDDLVAAVIDALADRGALDRTVLFFLTDNGMSLGEHRWLGKTCPYEECIRTPFLVRFPGATARQDPHLVSNVDLAPTIADLAGVTPSLPVDGLSLVPLLEGVPEGWRSGVFLDYVGDDRIPEWSGVRTAEALYVEYVTGERELYDLTGALGPADPNQLDNRANDAVYAVLMGEFASQLDALRGGEGTRSYAGLAVGFTQ